VLGHSGRSRSLDLLAGAHEFLLGPAVARDERLEFTLDAVVQGIAALADSAKRRR
jgi:hypothetical protein